MRTHTREDDGFTLVEVVISLALISGIMAAALLMFVRTMSNTDLQAQRQQAISVATDRMEQLRAISAGELAKVTGRSQAEVSALWAWDSTYTQQSVARYDSTTPTSAELVPTIETLPAIDGVPYVVRSYIDTCYLPTSSTTCGTSSGGGAREMLRLVVSVAWSPRRTANCAAQAKPAAGCEEYVVASLRDASDDPMFNVGS